MVAARKAFLADGVLEVELSAVHLRFADVVIEYSINGGSTWTTIAPSVDTSQPEWSNYPWVVPNQPSNQVRINIYEYFGTAQATSAAFTITSGTSQTAITNPVAGATLVEGSTITLSGTGTNLSWSYDAGAGPVAIGTGASVPFTVPTGITSLTLTLTGASGTDTQTHSVVPPSTVFILKADDNTSSDPAWVPRYAAGVNSWGINGQLPPGSNGFINWASFPGPDGTYKVELGAVLEPDGAPDYAFRVDGVEKAAGSYPIAGGSLDCTQTNDAFLEVRDLNLGFHFVGAGSAISFWGRSAFPCSTTHGAYARFYQIRFTLVGPPPAGTPGDANEDGSVTMADLNLLVDWNLGRTAMPAAGSAAFVNADVNGDGAISMADLNRLVDFLLGRIPSL